MPIRHFARRGELKRLFDSDQTVESDWTFTGNTTLDGDVAFGGNITGIPSVTSGSELASGVYTPTLTNSTNVAASTAFECQWMRVGTCVMVSGKVNIDPTAASTSTVLLMSLPTAATLANVEQLGGIAHDPEGSTTNSCGIRAATATNEARFEWLPESTANTAFAFIFMYQI